MIPLKIKIEATLLLLIASVLYAAVAMPVRAGDTPATIEYTRCYIGGVENAARCFDIDVPLDWNDPDGRKINLHGAIIPAKSMHVDPDPLLILAGGPGQAATNYGTLVSRAFHRINERRDVILIDQRGTGRSNPLNCEFPTDVVGDIGLDRLSEMVRECHDKIDTDVRYFTSRDILKDLEYVRGLMGVDKFNLWGGSYGTRLGLHYIRHYPESVRSAILDGVTPPNNSLFLMAPATAETAWQKLIEACKADESCAAAYPNLSERFTALLNKLETEPLETDFRDPTTGKVLRGRVTRDWVSEAVRSALYAPSQGALLPYAITQAEAGNVQTFGALLANAAAWAGSTMFIGSTLSILCQEDVPAITSERAAEAGRNSFHGDGYYRNWAAFCAHWPVMNVEADYHEPVSADVPVMILSGGLDPITPYATGAVAEESLTNSVHLVADNAGHNVSPFGCAPNLMADFVNSAAVDDIDGSCLYLPVRPAFLIAPSGPRP